MYLSDRYGPTGTNQNENYPTVGNLQMEFLISAFACDMTRVGSVWWSRYLARPWRRSCAESLCHGNAAGVGRFVQAERWYVEQFVLHSTTGRQ